jgi:hypothetical protein
VTRTRVTVGLSGAAAIGLLLAAGAVASDAPTVTGIVSATEQESDEGYFAVGSDTMIVAKPNSRLHHWLRQRTGQEVRVTIVVTGAGATE